MRLPHDSLTASERQVLADVEATGLHVVHEPDTDGLPGHSYSVGLWESFGQPEVLVFGLPPEVAAELLEAVADANDEGNRFVADSRHEGLLQDYPVRFFAVPPARTRELLGVAAWAYEGAEFPAVQLVWPDKHGRWPWEAAAREGFRTSQPVLGRPESRA